MGASNLVFEACVLGFELIPIRVDRLLVQQVGLIPPRNDRLCSERQ